MARPGPAPTPTALKMLRGNPRRRPLNAQEPKPECGVPECPAWLPPLAREHWLAITPQLRAVGVLSLIDGDALAAYCAAWARWREAEQVINENGITYVTGGDTPMVRKRPEVEIAKAMYTIMLRYQQEFGLTPASRSRVTVDDSAVQDEFADFVAGIKIV